LTITVLDLIYTVSDAIIIASLVTIAYVWLAVRDVFEFVMTPPSMRLLIGSMLLVDALTYLLDLMVRFWSQGDTLAVLAHIALAVIAGITAMTVFNRMRILHGQHTQL
jgi:ABC-type multidrug transport system permease subunit